MLGYFDFALMISLNPLLEITFEYMAIKDQYISDESQLVAVICPKHRIMAATDGGSSLFVFLYFERRLLSVFLVREFFVD